MKIQSESIIAFPLDEVYQTYRDRLPEIAAFMPDVREIQVLKRQDGPTGPKLHNRWFASTELPSVAKNIVKPEWMQWDDHADWNDAGRYVAWRLELPALGQQVQCSGRNSFFAAPGGTRVALSGDLEIKLQNIPGVPSFMAKRLAPQVEAFIIKLITPNLEKVNASLERFLQSTH
jgi:hypothetical protein